MTSTSFNVGLGDNGRVSSRVLRPPGGGHTDIFGGEPEPQQQINRRGGPAPSGMAALVAQEMPKTNGTEAPSQNGQTTPQEPSAPLTTPEEKHISPAKPEPAKPEPAAIQPAKAEAPKRVRVPPGGFSSGLW